MKGTPKTMANLQEAINLEAQLYGIYKLYFLDTKRFGLGIAEDGWHKIHKQAEDFQDQLISRLFFLEGDPQLAPVVTTTEDGILAMLQKATELETAIIDQYAQFTKDAWGEGDMSDFHFFQHLSKWHGCGDDKYVGHLSTLQKWSWQIAKTGEPDFIAAKMDKD